MKINDLFFELSHEGRYKILLAIYKGKKKHTNLENDLDLTGPEISRHLKRLQEEKLIEKTIKGYYQITSFGKLICSIIPLLENSLQFIDFINSHDFEDIPIELFIQIGNFKDLQLKTETMGNVELWSQLITNSKTYIYAITDQLQTSVIPIIQKRIQTTGLEIKAIIDRELFNKFTKPEHLPQNANKLIRQIDFFKNIKMAEKLNLSMIITDNGAILFLRAGDSIDYSQCIFGKSKSFLKWAKRLFDMFWNRVKIIKPSDLP